MSSLSRAGWGWAFEGGLKDVLGKHGIPGIWLPGWEQGLEGEEAEGL